MLSGQSKMERAVSGKLYIALRSYVLKNTFLRPDALVGLLNIGKKSVKDLTCLAGKEFPTDVDSYEVLEDCGRGVSATVYRALCKPLNEIVAVRRALFSTIHKIPCGFQGEILVCMHAFK